jgi:ABC-type antimicrobial peptide transport system permease subunit
LLIAVIGVYGLLAYAVAQRKPELGIRLALGASPSDMAWLLARQTLLRTMAGLVGGLAAAWWFSLLFDSLLFGVRAHDPAIFVGVAALLLVAALAAVAEPAWRAMKIDSMSALRVE